MTGRPISASTNRYLEKIKTDDGSGNRHAIRQSLFYFAGFFRADPGKGGNGPVVAQMLVEGR